MYNLNRVYRRASRVPCDMAFRVSSFRPIDSRLEASYERAVAEHEGMLPKLHASDCEIVSSLRERGLVITTLEELGLEHTREMFAGGLSIASRYSEMAAEGVSAFKDPYLVAATPSERLQHPAIFRWGLNERLLNIMENYLGLPPAYNGVNLFYTLADGQERGSRCWHKDGEDRKTIKVAVYLNNVDLEGGPFEVLGNEFPGSDSRCAPGLTDEMLKKLTSDVKVTSCVGAAGTVILCDTARLYHRGRPAVARDRAALFYTYFASPPRNPFYCERSVFSQSEIDDLTRGLSQYQLNSANWRLKVKGVGRLIFPQ